MEFLCNKVSVVFECTEMYYVVLVMGSREMEIVWKDVDGGSSKQIVEYILLLSDKT